MIRQLAPSQALGLVKPVRSSAEDQQEKLTLGALTQNLEKGGLDIEKLKQNILATKQAAEREAQALQIQQQSGGDPSKAIRAQVGAGVRDIKDLQDLIESETRIGASKATADNLAKDNLRADETATFTRSESERKRIEAETANQEKIAREMAGEMIPGSSSEDAEGNEVAMFRVRDSVGSYRNEQRVIGKVKKLAPSAMANDTVTTEQGVFQWNPTSNKYDIRIGDRPKPASTSTASPDGLTSNQRSSVQSLAKSFDSNPVVKNFNESTLRFEGLKGLVGGKWTGPADMATVFEFMRALDPTSVVRESEYASAAKTGNIFKGWAAKFNGLLNPSGGFLSDQVKKDFVAALEQKMKSASKQVKNLYDDFGRRINKITGRDDGTSELTDYTVLFDDATPVLSVSSGGKTYTFDSKEKLNAFKKEAGIK